MRKTIKWRPILASLFIGIALFALMSAGMVANADVANPEPFTYRQPNGVIIQVSLNGDEFLGWAEDPAGNLIIHDKDAGGLCYAIWDDDGAVSTGELVGNLVGARAFTQRAKGRDIPWRTRERAQRNREEATAIMSEAGIDLQDLAEAMDFESHSPPVPASADSLKRKLLIIHVTWTDRTGFASKPKLSGEQINDFVFNSATRSVNDYYKELIGTNEDIVLPASVSIPLDGYQGIIEVTLPGAHSDPKNNTTNQRNLMNLAVTQAVEQGRVNFSMFDTNGNGTIETTELSIGILVDGFNSSSYLAGPGFWGVAISGGTPDAADTN